MKQLRSETKTAVAMHLRGFADMKGRSDSQLAAIAGLGELGGPVAVQHIEEMMDEAYKEANMRERWDALLLALGRAGRLLPD